MDSITSRGLAAASTGQPTPNRSRTPGLKFSTRTSQAAARSSSRSAPAGWCRSSRIDRLPALTCEYNPERPRITLPYDCATSVPGSSALTTSAPRSARIRPANGPATARDRSSTRSPSRGLGGIIWSSVCSLAGRGGMVSSNQRAAAQWALAVGALGVVFGDIGTSPLYTVQTVFNPSDPHPVTVSTQTIFGIVSLIFWSITIIVTLTYVVLVMRADNDGEGGVMALIALIRRGGVQGGRRRRWCCRRSGSSAPRCSSATA